LFSHFGYDEQASLSLTAQKMLLKKVFQSSFRLRVKEGANLSMYNILADNN